MSRTFWVLLFIIPVPFVAASVGTIKELNVHNGTWTSYGDRLELYFKANNIDEDSKVPTLLTLIGEDAYQLLVSSVTPSKPADLTYKEASDLLYNHLEPSSSIHEGRYQFRQTKQNNEILQYVKELQKLSQKCKFGAVLGDNLRDQFVYGLKSDVVRRRLFAEGAGLTFADAVKIATQASSGTGEDVQLNCPGSDKVPFSCPIPGMYPGRVIRVKASTSSIAQRFSINLQRGPSIKMHDEVAVHIAFRFDERIIVLNHLFTSIQGSKVWGKEIRERSIPIARGEEFEVVILCEENDFKLIVNGKEFTEFQHRILYQYISHVNFEGDVKVQALSFEDASDNH